MRHTLAACFILLTALDGRPLKVRPEMIAIISEPLKHQCERGTLIYASGKALCVKQTSEQIERMTCHD